MKTVFVKYRMLDGTEKTILKQIGSGRVIRLFNRTPYPVNDHDVVCCHFHELACVYGCPYNCAWCLEGGTLVLTADLQWVPIRYLKVGDKVLGVEFHGRSRRIVGTPIIAKSKRVDHALKMTVEGNSIIGSKDHRWLTIKRRFTHTYNLRVGREVAFLGSADPPELADIDYQRGYFAGISRGDGAYRVWQRGKQPYYQLVMKDTEALWRAKAFVENLCGITLNLGTHKAERFGESEIPMLSKRGRYNIEKLGKLLKLGNGNSAFMKGFLSGFFDAEGGCDQGLGETTGYHRTILRFFNSSGLLLQLVEAYLKELGYESRVEEKAMRLLGGLPAALTFFANTIPAISRKKLVNGRDFGVTRFEHAEVEEVEDVGKRELYDIQTGTGNFIAEGLVSHNCYLKGTFRFFQQSNGRIPVRLKKEKDVLGAIRTFLTLGKDEVPATVLNTGELADSLSTEGATAFYGKPFSEYIMPFFEGTRHKVLFLSKGTNVKNFLKHEWQKNAILSWTINAYPVAERWELLAPHPRKRIEAAKKVAEAGYEVRVRIDPMVAVDGFEQHYQKLVDDLYEAFTPSRITLGCLRGLTSTMARAVDKSWIPYLTERSSWGRKPPIETRYSMYANILNKLKGLDRRELRDYVGICKDTIEVWKMLKKEFGLDWQKLKCNCSW